MPTASDKNDRLPLKGYTSEQLKDYIYRQLGLPVWNVELDDGQILDTIQDALAMWSIWVPLPVYAALSLTQGKHEYLADEPNIGNGVVDVQFVEPNPVPTEIFYGNLINPAPLFRAGIDEYDTFLRWRKTWQRVTSVQPDWLWDENRQVLYVHNPIERYTCAVLIHGIYEDTKNLPLNGARWVKQYALEKSRYLLGEILAKFGSAIPGPLKDIQLDSGKRDKAEVQIAKLEEEVKRMQSFPAIITD